VAGSAIVQLIFSMAGREPSDESLAAVIKWSRYRRVPAHPEGASFNPNQPKGIQAADPGAAVNLISAPARTTWATPA
jgi:hypothetical protein